MLSLHLAVENVCAIRKISNIFIKYGIFNREKTQKQHRDATNKFEISF